MVVLVARFQWGLGSIRDGGGGAFGFWFWVLFGCLVSWVLGLGSN